MPLPFDIRFPVEFAVGPYLVPAHMAFEALGYVVGFQWYLRLRRRHGDPLRVEHRGWLVVAAVLGAVVGSKVLGWLVEPIELWQSRADPAAWLGGKTIVGGLLGGLLAVELAKRRLGITRRTGDLYAQPLALGLAVGRIGCFLAGLPDRTHGDFTSLPWGVDFGDGARHPTQLYEIGFLLLLMALLLRLSSRPHRDGDVWRAFLLGYLGWRVAVGFIQPGFTVAGLTAIQWTSLAGVVAYAGNVPRIMTALIGRQQAEGATRGLSASPSTTRSVPASQPSTDPLRRQP